jgi:hypothetical protein
MPSLLPRKVFAKRTASSKRVSRRLCLEVLEDRTLPSIFFQPGPEGKDTYIDNRIRPDLGLDLRTINYGSDERMLIGHNDTSNSAIADGLVQFDVSGLPGDQVQGATVVLRIKPVFDGAGTPTTVFAHRVTK